MAKWAGLCLTTFVITTAIFAIWYSVLWCNPVWPFISIEPGRVYFNLARGHPAVNGPVGLHVDRHPATVQPLWPAFVRLGTQRWSGNRWHFEVMCPYWLLVVVVGVPTAVLWWLDRRRFPPGHCPRCGYDLTGNVSGVCPECGAAAPGRPADVPQPERRE